MVMHWHPHGDRAWLCLLLTACRNIGGPFCHSQENLYICICVSHFNQLEIIGIGLFAIIILNVFPLPMAYTIDLMQLRHKIKCT